MAKNSRKKIGEYLKKQSLDAFLVLTRLNRQYVSGFTGSMGAVVVTSSRAELFVDDRYTIRAGRESDLRVSKISELKLQGRIGVEDKISVREFQKLRKDFPRAKFTVTDNVIENLRALKSEKEINHIRKAQNIIDKIFAQVKKMKLLGMTELALSQKMQALAVKLGADGMAFESIVAWGPNAAAPHHLSSNQKIKKNNFLLLDFGVLVDNYHSDFTRTLFIGSPNKKQEEVYSTVLEAQKKGIAMAIAGHHANSVDRAAREYIESKGFGDKFTHNTGHGVGLEIHELPNFSPKSDDKLAPGMIVTVEPGIYIRNWGGVRIEDMVLLKSHENEVLPKSPNALKSMIIK